MRVLLTGFEPFGGELINPAWEVVRQIAQEQLPGITVTTRLLPTAFDLSIQEVILAITQDRPDMVISLGQAGGRSDVSIERVALNINDASIPDNEGKQPCDTSIVEGGPAAYFSTLPIRAMVEAIRGAGIPARVSNTAGTFVCNHTMYGVLHHIAEKHLPIQAGFIHIPYLPVQAVQRGGAPSMSLGDLTVALRMAIIVGAQHGASRITKP